MVAIYYLIKRVTEMDFNFSSLREFVKTLSWQKIFQTLIFFTILLASWAFWENRVTIYNSIRVGARVEVDDALPINISSSTRSYLDSSLDKSKFIVAGVEITSVNFRKNSRFPALFITNNKELKDAYEDFMKNKISESPLFTDNEINNQKVIHLINGEFVCYDYKDSTAHRLYSSSVKSIVTVCSISIPPYYGRFTGYMNVYLTTKPQNDELIYIKQLSRDMSLRVYETDIDKSPGIKY